MKNNRGFFLAGLTILLLASCHGQEPVASTSSAFVSLEPPVSSLPLTSYNLMIHGVSEYALLLPETPSENVRYAVKEFQTLWHEASGVTLPIIETATETQPVISFGKTSRFEAADISITATLGNSGYGLKTIGNSLYLFDDPTGDDEGILAATYRVLEDAFDYRFYTGDVYDFTAKEDVPLYDYNEVEIPAFDQRELGYYELVHDESYRKRMRLISRHSDTVWSPILAHSQTTFVLRWNEYHDAHPDWFSGSAQHNQLCWTAGEEMENEFAKVFYQRWIASYPQATYFMIGQEDNQFYCTCERCQKAMKEYGMNHAGLQLVFVNHVIEKTNALIAQYEPERLHKVKYLMFAYQGTLEPPATKGEDGKYRPYSSQIQAAPDLFIEYTPIIADFSHALTDDENQFCYEALQGWKSIAKGRLMAWTYDTNFSHYYVNFNNFSTWVEHMEELKKAGVSYVFSQGSVDSPAPTLEEMRIYAESHLLWDPSLSYDDLVQEFMKGYYQEAGDALYHYYEITRDRYAVYQTEVSDTIGGIYANIESPDIWTEPVVNALQNAIDDAYLAIAKYKTDDPDRYQALFLRIKRQELTVLYLKLAHYQSSYSDSEVSQMISDFYAYSAQFGITNYAEITSVQGRF